MQQYEQHVLPVIVQLQRDRSCCYAARLQVTEHSIYAIYNHVNCALMI